MKVIVEGKELIPEKNNILIVSNHQSNLDPLMIIGAFKGKPVTFIMKNNIMKVPIVGTWLYVSGFLPDVYKRQIFSFIWSTICL